MRRRARNDITAQTLHGTELPARHRSMSYVFGTLVKVIIADEPPRLANEAATALLAEFDRLHWKLHAWKSGDIVELNRAIAAGQDVPIDPEIGALICDARRLSDRSGGLFNPAIGGLVRLWHFHDDVPQAALPEMRAIAPILDARPQMNDLDIREGVLLSRNPLVQIDFGGYAKGYALDRAREILQERGISNVLLNVGGQIMAHGRCGSRPWAVALRAPRGDKLLATLDLHDGEIISTSGDYERFFVIDGKRYSHVIDPRTGFPVSRTRAVTVLTIPCANSGAWSDAASGALFVAGADNWCDTAQRMGVNAAMLVDDRGTVHFTRDMASRLQMLADVPVRCVD